MEIISGFEGKDIKEFIGTIKKIWKKEASKGKNAQDRYQLVIGKMNQRGIFTPTVSTKGGTETILLWNISQENIKELKEEALRIELPISFRSYVWFDKIPPVLPKETEGKKER